MKVKLLIIASLIALTGSVKAGHQYMDTQTCGDECSGTCYYSDASDKPWVKGTCEEMEAPNGTKSCGCS